MNDADFRKHLLRVLQDINGNLTDISANLLDISCSVQNSQSVEDLHHESTVFEMAMNPETCDNTDEGKAPW
jgi:hypothetical protein